MLSSTAVPVTDKGIKLDCAYRLDLMVEDSVVVERKAIDSLNPIHTAQLLTYLKSMNKRVGLLINFNVLVLKHGLKRVVNRYSGPLLTGVEGQSETPPRSPLLRASALNTHPAKRLPI